MTQQTEAKRLADALDALLGYRGINADVGKAAAELRRLDEKCEALIGDTVRETRQIHRIAVLEAANEELLEALEMYKLETDSDIQRKAIAVLRERLAHRDRCGKKMGGEGDIHTCTPKPEQEPVAWPCEVEEADFEQDTITLKMLTTEYVIRAGKHWLSTTPPAAAQPAPVQEPNAAALFNEALAFGLVYGPAIPAHQWDEMREEKVAQLVARLATPPAQPAPAGYTIPPAAAHMTEFEEAVATVDNTLHHAIDHWQDKASEQAALLRECRAALDSLIEKKPELAALLCGSTTLGNLRASLHDYRVIFDDTPPAAQRQHVTDGSPCWCEPETSYTDPETGASVIVHKGPQ